MRVAVAEDVQLEARLLPADPHEFHAQLVDKGRVLDAGVPEHPDLPRQRAPGLARLVDEGLLGVVDDERVAALGIERLLQEGASDDRILLALDDFFEVIVHLVVGREPREVPQGTKELRPFLCDLLAHDLEGDMRLGVASHRKQLAQ